MSNHPNRSVRFEIVGPKRPWFIKVDCGALDWPALVFPFQITGAGTDEGERTVRAAGRAALKAAALYYRHDETGSFLPQLWLLNADQGVVHGIPVVRTDE